jgi:hypothetical protein
MRSLNDGCGAYLAYDKREQPRKSNKEVLATDTRVRRPPPERLGVTFDARLFIFLEGAESRPILAIDELFDALIFPRPALEKR